MITAALPVVFGFVTEGVPSMLAIVGIAAAAVGVVLVSFSPAPADGRPSGLWYGIVTGFVFGLFPIVANGISDDLLVASRRGHPDRVDRDRRHPRPGPSPAVARPAAPVAGACSGSASSTCSRRPSYLAALAVGPLAIAAILTSLYPVVTVILAALVLRERITPVHAVGIVAAGLAVVLIAVA